MPNPLRSWKFFPWRSLFAAALMTVAIVKLLDLGIVLAVERSPQLLEILKLLFGGRWGLLTFLLISAGIGAIAVLCLETWCRPGPIYASTLWALVLCLLVTLVVVAGISSLLNWPGILLNLNETMLIGLVLGVFWQGRRHWRSF